MGIVQISLQFGFHVTVNSCVKMSRVHIYIHTFEFPSNSFLNAVVGVAAFDAGFPFKLVGVLFLVGLYKW